MSLFLKVPSTILWFCDLPRPHKTQYIINTIGYNFSNRIQGKISMRKEKGHGVTQGNPAASFSAPLSDAVDLSLEVGAAAHMPLLLWKHSGQEVLDHSSSLLSRDQSRSLSTGWSYFDNCSLSGSWMPVNQEAALNTELSRHSSLRLAILAFLC